MPLTYYNMQSQVTNKGGIPLVIDIQGASNKPVKAGTLLDAYTPTGNENQWWTLVLDPPSGYHFIQSKLTDPKGNPLVIDIQGASNKPGALLDAYREKSKNNANQLWQLAG